ncbi:hypothetical protein CDD80_6879 [Ophiocordyceps camponoti-rufipedis]|uniref:Zinc finger C3HC4 RING-type domain-containing protein n=1 Tax=Ophiocordyceps camponoti-rufipedis TaxID=2004952 RepID=A0A2C5XYP0_9HYPO|nr:hypothetical protein CDD80_6879 [Ophiocordyceps camponoti-rufipedis]
MCWQHQHISVTMLCPCHHRLCFECVARVINWSLEYPTDFPPRCCDEVIDVDAILNYLPLDLVSRWQAHEHELNTRAAESSRYTTPVHNDNSSPLATAGTLDTDPERSTQSPREEKPDRPLRTSTPLNFDDWWTLRQEALEAEFVTWLTALKSRVTSDFDDWLAVGRQAAVDAFGRWLAAQEQSNWG